jgi:hypothetical protein
MLAVVRGKNQGNNVLQNVSEIKRIYPVPNTPDHCWVVTKDDYTFEVEGSLELFAKGLMREND